MIRVLGKVTVTHAGTPVPLSAAPLQCNQIVCMTLNDNTKGIVFGDVDMVLATLVHCMSDLLSAGTGFNIPPNTGLGNHADAGAVYIDAEVDGEGVVAYAIL